MGIFDWFRKPAPTVHRAEADAIEPHTLAAREATRRPVVRVSYERSGLQLLPTMSKLGGTPYAPVDSDQVPSDAFVFIAQLNFAEVPPIDDLPLPRTGIVQFWVLDDDTYGLYGEHGRERSDGHRCIYYPDVDIPQAPRVQPHLHRGPLFGLDERNGRRLRFELASELDPPEDGGHKIGGYCSFTQSDPRDPADPLLSLLQLDDDADCGWGDAGIAHWFIRDADLRACNFANVRYYWDCC